MANVSGENSLMDKQLTPDWLLAREGITLVINNRIDEAKELFLKRPDSLVVYAGYSFAVMMDALMSYEEEKLNKAIATLKEVERRCDTESGWLKQVTQRVFSFTSVDTKPDRSLADQLETQIILADSQVCIAILSFLQQEISAYLKGGWVLRKAWKVYQKVYKDILNLYKEHIGELQLPDPSQSLTPSPEPPTDSSQSSELDPSDTEVPEKNGDKRIEKDVLIRLMGAVSFGYGLFQLGISLLPPSLVKLISILGFTTNRQNGIACLMYSRTGIDMRAPLATLSLLWYHTIVRPFYAVDGTNVQAGVDSSIQLLKESEAEFSESALFLFFQGRVCRLNSDIKNALKAFHQAAENSTQRELKILCMHEVGWCYLIELDYGDAQSTFSYLKLASRWSKAFYSYLAAICGGACCKEPSTLIGDLSNITTSIQRGTQLDEFLTRRARRCPTNADLLAKKTPIYWRLLIFEMLYLWNALPSCTQENIDNIAGACRNVFLEHDEPMVGLSKLILGCVLCIQNNHEDAMVCFKTCLEMRKNILTNNDDNHISAFCLYELGVLLLKSEQTKEEGKLYLRQISEYSGYDFEQKLNVRVYSLLKQM